MHRIGEVEDIDDGMEAKLTGLGIRTTDDFLVRAATAAGRAALASEVGSTAATVLTWANCADLMRVDGIGMQFADLLEAAGVDTIPELAQRNGHNLYERVAALNAEQKLTGRAPTEAEVEAWIVQAKALPRILEYTGASGAAAPAPEPAPLAAVAPEPAPLVVVADETPVVDAAASAATQTVDSAASATQDARSEASAGAEHAVDAGREQAGDVASDTSARAQDATSSAASRLGSVSSPAGSAGAGWWQKLMARLRGR